MGNAVNVWIIISAPVSFLVSVKSVLSGVGRNQDHDWASIHLALSKSKLQRPYITRLITLILLTVLSARLLLNSYSTSFKTASISSFSPEMNLSISDTCKFSASAIYSKRRCGCPDLRAFLNSLTRLIICSARGYLVKIAEM